MLCICWDNSRISEELLEKSDLAVLLLSEFSVGGRPTNSTNPLRVCQFSSEVLFEHGENILNPSLLVYKVPPINCLTDLTPTFR